MRETFGKCRSCGGPLIPLFLPGSLVCLRECDLAPTSCKPLQLDQREGDSEWASRMMAVDSGAIMRCIGCTCPGSSCKGAEYRIDSYVGQVLHKARLGWSWTRVAMKPNLIVSLFPVAFTGHRWRNVGEEPEPVV